VVEQHANGHVSYGEALRAWARIALQSFGGPAGQIAVMHRILVEEKRWISEERFLHALNYCMLLPGPEAQQLATYVGWLLHGVRGGLTAGILFVLPGFVSILALSLVYVTWGDVALVDGLFFGLGAAVLAIVAQAVVRIGKRVLKSPALIAIAALAFVAIHFLHVPFPAIVLGAALAGLIGSRLAPRSFVASSGHASSAAAGRAPDAGSDAGSDDGPGPALRHVRPTLARALRVSATCGALWATPIALLAWWAGADSVYVQEGVFFSKAAVVTFGGAYAVLSYIAQAGVETYGWLAPGEMLDGLGMAETTPGPLIQVVQFVGFMGAHRNPGTLSPIAAGILGSLVTTWVTFVPCFLWIFLGAPYVEALRGNRRLSAALSAITAAVVGVILNLAVWFALHTLFGAVDEHAWDGVHLLVPVGSSVSWPALALSLAALVATFRYRIGTLPLLAGCAALGALLTLAGAA
jgi:chromate transporter